MKPLGLSVQIDLDDLPRMSVSQPSRVEDAVWDAVEAAIDAGWSPERFRAEVADAWQGRLRDEARHAEAVLTRQ